METSVEQYEELIKKGFELKKKLKKWYMKEPSSVLEIWQLKQGLIEITLFLMKLAKDSVSTKKFLIYRI
ncbi:MAG: hypothetical protein N2257_01515 [Thermodesulfovibrionales bacterium]|nr:hypothetical protein [Thermodesulfovibrionales bacterium]